MNKIKIFLLLFSVLAVYKPSQGQCPSSDFAVPNSVCIGENLVGENISTDASSYEWDFCGNDIVSNPSLSSLNVINGGSVTTGITNIFDGKDWYGFIVSRGNGKLFRLEYENDLSSTPEVREVGNSTALTVGVEQIDLVQEGNNWYGLIMNYESSKILLANFGSSLQNVPIINEVTVEVPINKPRGIKLYRDGFNYIGLIGNTGNTLTRLNFGSTMSNIPVATNITIPGSSGLFGISLVRDCGNNHILLTSYNGAIFRLDFGTSLLNPPIISNLSLGTGVSAAIKIEATQEGGEFYAIIVTTLGKLFRLSFGSLISNTAPLIEDLGTFSELNNTYGLSLEKSKSKFVIHTIAYSDKVLRKLEFEAPCSANVSFSNYNTPSNVFYSAAGTYDITLTATDEDGNSSSVTKQITVLDQQAPQIAIQANANLCLDNHKTFTESSDQTLTSQTWDFGDGSTATGSEVSHQYTEPGTYKVRLTVESENGCGNFIEKEVNIYEAPAPDFSFPAESICTNGAVVFENTTPGDYKEEDITWHWDFGDGITSAEKTPTHTYTTGGTKTVKLTAAIPGCSETQEYQINVVEGPAVNFVADHLCFEDVVQFTNLSSGEDISSFAWDFGNGETSTAENPSMTFTAAGEYEVSLTVSNAIGCSNTFTETIKINALPAVSFENTISCTGAGTQFQDKSTVADGSVGSWKWDFGDGTTATERNPTHTFTEAGTYDVKLIVTSVAGCIDSVTQTVDVSLAPIADFEVALGCPGALTQFTNTSEDLAGDGIEVTYWIINGVYHYTPNPAVLFTKAGTYSVTLAVTSGASCKSTITKNIVVDPLPTPDFTFDNACVGAATIFADQSIAFGDDEVVSWNWEFGNFATATEQHPEVVFPGEGNYGVSLRVTTERGCSAVINKTVTINSLPQAAFAPVNNFGAPPLEVKFRNNSAGAVSYQWHFGDAAHTSSEEAEPVFVYTEVGDYDVRLIATNAGGCADTAHVAVSVLISEVDVALEKINTFTNTGNMQTVLTIRNNGTVPVESMNINLDLGGKVSLNERFTGFIGPGESQNYPLGFDILAEDFPTISYICATLAVTGMSKEELDVSNNSLCYDLKGAFLLTEPYPNPVDQILHVEFFMPDESPVRMVLSDILGNSVMDFEVANTKKGLNEFNYDFSHLAAGMYVLKISHREESVIKRLVVQ